MANWSKLTVAKLKEECAFRHIHLTGLKLKQHFIEKLEEWEASQSQGGTKKEHEHEEHAIEEVDVQPESTTALVEEKPENNITDSINGQDDNYMRVESSTGDKPAAGDPEALSEPVNNQLDTQERHEAENQQQMPEASKDTRSILSKTAEEDESTQAAVVDSKATQGQDEAAVNAAEAAPGQEQEQKPAEEPATAELNEASQPEEQTSMEQTPVSTSVPPGATQDSTRSSSIVPPTESSEDARKRKRRSVTPTPQAEEIALKKAKGNDGSPLVRARIGPEQEQAAVDNAEVGADVGPLAHQHSAVDTQLKPRSLPPSDDLRDVRSASPVTEKPVAPALHPATSTLYIRNFKRPLRQPDLQAHIASHARSSQGDPDSSPIGFFYLDVLRTHAFVRLHSISAASRVRSAVHGTRWPDEPTRDKLWADFIPDDKAEAWANQEADANAGSGFGSRGSGGKRWEVIYREGPDGAEAILQDANEVKITLQQRKPSFSQGRKPSAVLERGLPTGVHPDRAVLVSGSDTRTSSRAYEDRPPPTRQPKNAEKSFAALDELFNSTAKTKPKLYYKPVAPQVVDERMELIKGLRIGHNGMGRSGDEGMKRYTFDWERGKQEWVDKGPEFGFGRKGQERLTGDRGRGGGGYRGRGGGSRYPRGGGGGGRGFQDWDAPPPPRRGGDGWRGGY